MTEDLSSQQEDPNRVYITIQNTGTKVRNEIEDINQQIFRAKIPFLNYYHPENEVLKSKKEIILEMQNTFAFFQNPVSSSHKHLVKFGPKDFYSEIKPSLATSQKSIKVVNYECLIYKTSKFLR